MRILSFIVLVLFTGYLSVFGLFADGAAIISTLLFLSGCVAVGALYPKRWQLSALCSWGALLLTGLELGSQIGSEPVAGQQPLAQVLLTAVGALGLALLGGYIGFRLRTKNEEKNG
ncbi:MAG: hypothetical protein HN736_11680 [Anaerolineae bacterium]|jgi:hypothetical protein|nr:hypothetical protein [Anaerolineae bacterium]MBT3714314.1 hypothetical protein [Anaerolineae bacterium]MBT4311976.1 hypothetical protein [Anaerolineae bacterium]MBT4458124.1 hypothetical protein [Anaerolineae bacterium]MBT6059563.1 hypothetical protein [Anaerolineae bacterium]